jgi:hypothetical protein
MEDLSEEEFKREDQMRNSEDIKKHSPNEKEKRIKKN